MLLRLAYLTVTSGFAMLRLLPMSDRAKDVEILALRHQLTILQRQLGGARVRFAPADRAFLAALLHRLPGAVLHQVRLVVRPETVLRWHRDLIAARHAHISRPRRVGRPRTIRSVRLLVLRLASENGSWGYRRIHGELLVLGINVAASTVWEILKDAGIDPAPERTSITWAAFLRSQAQAVLAADFFEVVTLTGQHMHVLAVIEHATRRVRLLGATAHPTAAWVTQAVRNLAIDLEDAGSRARYLIRDRDGKYPPLFDTILNDTGITVVLTGVRMPRMNAITSGTAPGRLHVHPVLRMHRSTTTIAHVTVGASSLPRVTRTRKASGSSGSPMACRDDFAPSGNREGAAYGGARAIRSLSRCACPSSCGKRMTAVNTAMTIGVEDYLPAPDLDQELAGLGYAAVRGRPDQRPTNPTLVRSILRAACMTASTLILTFDQDQSVLAAAALRCPVTSTRREDCGDRSFIPTRVAAKSVGCSCELSPLQTVTRERRELCERISGRSGAPRQRGR
jgi:putative transposase